MPQIIKDCFTELFKKEKWHVFLQDVHGVVIFLTKCGMPSRRSCVGSAVGRSFIVGDRSALVIQ